jgi:hypothetical protein
VEYKAKNDMYGIGYDPYTAAPEFRDRKGIYFGGWEEKKRKEEMEGKMRCRSDSFSLYCWYKLL